MKKLFRLIGSLGVAFVLAGATSAITIHVPGDSATIQAAINAAADGDTVLVAAGIYSGDGNRDLDYGGKDIVVMSENGPEVTIIDCDGHRGFSFHNGEGRDAVVTGFTIIHGYDTYAGGAINCIDASPTIRDNIFDDNHTSTRSSGEGGAVYCSGGGPLIEENLFSNNSAGHGGAICCLNSSSTISKNVIQDNVGYEMFGGGYGGGIFCNGGNPIITNNTISHNQAGWEMGGYGGGIVCRTVSALIAHNLFTHNSGGALILEYSSNAIVMSNTFSSNWDTAIQVQGGSSAGIFNNIVAYNGLSVWGLTCDLNLTNNNFYGNENDSVYVEGYYGVYFEWMDQIGINGNCRVNPLFCDTAGGDYFISSASYCTPENSESGNLIGALDAGCDGGYLCGDPTGDNIVNLGDPIYLICHIFKSGPPPFAVGAGDANCDNETNVGDAIYLINHIFRNGPEPCCP